MPLSFPLFFSLLRNCSRFMSSRSSVIQIFQALLASAAGSQLGEAQKETDIEMEGNNFSSEWRWRRMDRILMNSNNDIKIRNV